MLKTVLTNLSKCTHRHLLGHQLILRTLSPSPSSSLDGTALLLSTLKDMAMSRGLPNIYSNSIALPAMRSSTVDVRYAPMVSARCQQNRRVSASSMCWTATLLSDIHVNHIVSEVVCKHSKRTFPPPQIANAHWPERWRLSWHHPLPVAGQGPQL